MFNTIFGIQYQIKAVTNPAMKPWNEVKFDQNDYVETLSRTQAHANFVQTYTNICVELNK